MAFGFYVIISICFFVENREMVTSGDYLLLRILVGFGIWLVVAVVAVCIMTALMVACQQNAIKDMKRYYQKHFGVTVVNIDRSSEKEYHEYELSN